MSSLLVHLERWWRAREQRSEAISDLAEMRDLAGQIERRITETGDCRRAESILARPVLDDQDIADWPGTDVLDALNRVGRQIAKWDLDNRWWPNEARRAINGKAVTR